jgi:hypothetical protein
MKLVVHELNGSGLEQEYTPEKNTILEAVRPHIYRHNWPSGSLKVQILDADDIVLIESETINISAIGSQDFFHGYVTFLINYGLVKNETYKFKVVGEGGYSFSESAYIGLCNDFDLRKYDPAFTPHDGMKSALDLELWSRSTR